MEILTDIADAGYTIGRFKACQHHKNRCHNQSNNRYNLNHSKPKFNFTKNSDCNQIDHTQNGKEDDLNQPCWPSRKPKLDVLCNCRDFCHTDKNEGNPIGPTGKIAPAIPKILGNEVDKCVLVWIIIQHLSNRPHHQIHKDAGQHVNEDNRWPCQTNRTSCSQKETRSNCPSNSNDLDMTIF